MCQSSLNQNHQSAKSLTKNIIKMNSSTYADLTSTGCGGVRIVMNIFPPKYSSFSAFRFPVFHRWIKEITQKLFTP